MRFERTQTGLMVKPKFGSTSCEAMGTASLNLGLFKNNNNHLTFFYMKLPSTYWWSMSSWIWTYWTLICNPYSRQEVYKHFWLSWVSTITWFPFLGGEEWWLSYILNSHSSTHAPHSQSCFTNLILTLKTLKGRHNTFIILISQMERQLGRKFSKIPNPLNRGAGSRMPLPGPN